MSETDRTHDETAATDSPDPVRRGLLGVAVSASLAATATALPGCAWLPAGAASATLGFQPVAPSANDRAVVPEGYVAAVLARWGDAVGVAGALPDWRADAGNAAAEQALQIGQQMAGLQYLPLDGSRRGLLVLTHDAVDDGALHAGGAQPWTADKLRKAQAATGLSVVEVALQNGRWQLVQPAGAARRITATTPLMLTGPAAGHALLKTAADPDGRRALGLLGAGPVALTPWGTCLAAEQDWADLFTTADPPTRHERRYGLRRSPASRWWLHDERFDAVRHPNEPHRFGWVLEFDPRNPAAPAVKRSALGRGAWSAVATALAPDRRAVVYLADGGPFAAIVRFVSRDAVGADPADAARHAGLLDEGRLQVARFDADGSGRWLTLDLTEPGEMLIQLRHAAERAGATPMDRVGGIVIDPASGWVHAVLAGNAQRGLPGLPAADAANPVQPSSAGRLLRWRETAEPDRFEWLLVTPSALSGASSASGASGAGDGSPRGGVLATPGCLARDPRGALWMGTAVASAGPSRGDAAAVGNNGLLALDPSGGELRRFLAGPVNAAITGAAFTPDGRHLFVAVAHAGAAPGQPTDPQAPRRYSNWPDFSPVGRPRSAVLAVRRLDGGAIGG